MGHCVPKYRINGQRKESGHFQHQPLSPSQDQFRLIKITPNGPNGSVLCNVGHFDRADTHAYGSYTALSYTWGDVTAADSIYMRLADGGACAAPFTVTQNLAGVLRHIADASFSDPGKERWKGWWWIDALCIIQNEDDPEKDRQIKCMPTIYRNAAEVFAWIGPGTERTKVLFKQMDEYVDDPGYDLSELCSSMRRFENQLIPIADAAFDVLARPYWKRLWIIQELARSSNTVIACGAGELSFQQFRDYTSLIKGIRTTYLESDGLEQLRLQALKTFYILDLAARYHWPYHWQRDWEDADLFLAELINFSNGSLCGSDKKDRVRALLGLVTCGEGLHIDASRYRCPCSIMHAAMQAMIQDMHPQGTDIRRDCEDMTQAVLLFATTSSHDAASCGNNEAILSQYYYVASMPPVGRAWS